MSVKRPSPSFSLKRFGAFLSVVCMAILTLSAFTPAMAVAPAFSNPIQVASNVYAGTSGGETAANGCYFTVIGCSPETTYVRWDSSQQTWYILYPTNAISGSTTNFNYVYSKDGINWSGPVNAFTTGAQIFQDSGTAQAWAFDVSGTSLFFVYTYYGGSTVTVGTQYLILNIANPAAPTESTADTTLYLVAQGAAVRPHGVDVRFTPTSLAVIDLSTNSHAASGGTFWMMTIAVQLNNVQTSGSCTNGIQFNMIPSNSAGGQQALLQGQGVGTNSANCGNLNIAGTLFNAGGSIIGLESGGSLTVGGTWYAIGAVITSGGATACEVAQYNQLTSAWTTTAPTGAGTCGSYPILEWAKTDGGGNVWVIFQATNTFTYSTDGGTTYATATTALPTVVGGKDYFPISMSDINTVNGNLQSIIVGLTCTTLTCNPSGGYTLTGNLFVTVLTTGSTATNTTQTQTIGACPTTKDTSTFTPVNNTLYFYYGTSVATTSVSTISIGISSVGGATGTHTIGLYIYAATQAGAVSPSNNLYQSFVYTKALTSGTGHAILTVQVSGTLIPAGVQWGVGVIADNKIVLNQSTLAGMYTQAGVASNAVQSNFFTTQGTSVGTQISLCSTATYASSTTSTVTITTTSTTTQSATGSATQASASNLGNLLLGVIVIIGPAMLMAGATKQLWGAMLGAALGAAAGTFAGILPFYVIIVVVLAIIAVLFLGRNTGGGQGGGI